VLEAANLFPIDSKFAGENRKRMVNKWVENVLQ
jgi:hypothetical protein